MANNPFLIVKNKFGSTFLGKRIMEASE